MATCQELSTNQQIDNGRKQPESERICGTGKIVCVEEGFGIIRSINKDMIYFGEKNYLPSTKGILQVLKRKDFLCFVAKPSKVKRKIKWTAVSVWKPGYEPACQIKQKHSKADGVKQNKELGVKQDTEVEALSILKSILKSALSVSIGNLPTLISQESPDVQKIFLDEQKLLTFLKRHPSVFHFHDADKSVSLINETVHKAIRYVADLLAERGRLDLVSVRTAVSEHTDETVASYGRKAKQLKSFLGRFTDVFSLVKEGDQWFVALQPNILSEMDDNESVISSAFETFSDGAGIRPPSTASSMRSLSSGSSLHTSLSDLSVSLPAKNQGISKMLNALLKREPMPVKNLIGYVHTSPPEVRLAIGNTMEKLTNFLQNNENFFLHKPENQVYIRSTVERRALKYLTKLISKSYEGEVKLDEVLKFHGKHAVPEVMAFLGKNVSEVSLAIRQMIAKQELMSDCLLVLKDDSLSIEYSNPGLAFGTNYSHVQQLSEDENKLTTSVTDGNKDSFSDVDSSKCKGFFSDLEKSENLAVDCLRNLLERDEVLTIENVKEFLWHAPAEICEILADEDLITAFVKRHPSVFKMSGPINLIELRDDAVRDAIALCCNILNVKSDMQLTSLVGHISSASRRIRNVIGGTVAKLEDFLRQYFDVFHVYEGQQGLMASPKLRELISSRQSMTVTEELNERKDSVDARVSAMTTGLVLSASAKAAFSNKEPGGVDRCLAKARAANDSQNEPTVKPTREKSDSKVTTAKTSSGIDFLTSILKMHTTMVLRDIVPLVSQASKVVQDELGCSEQDVLSFVEENPAIFKISDRGFCVELISETCGDAIEFYLDVLNKRGPTQVSKIHGHLSQASSAIRTATGGSPESVKAFLLQFPNVFKLYEVNGIEIIASLYEGECVSKSSDDEKPDIAVSKGIDATRDSKPVERDATSAYVSNYDDPDFDFALTLSGRSSKAITTTSGSVLEDLDFSLLPTTMSEKYFDDGVSAEFNRLDQFDMDYILSMSETNQFRGAETRSEAKKRLDEIEDSNESTSSDPASANCEGTAAEIETDSILEDKISNLAIHVDVATETHPPKVNSSPMLQSSPLPLEQTGMVSEDLTNSQKADVASVPSFVTCVKDEHNVISDLCLQALSNNNGRAVDITELLAICQKANPLHSRWHDNLGLELLHEIIRNDNRFYINEIIGSVMLIRDVERMAAEFLRRCILLYGPMVFEKLSGYNYLSFASAEVKALLGISGISPAQFTKKSIKLLWPKYRDQLLLQNGVLVVPQDTESNALGFLSNLIETYGPLRLDSLSDYLPHASSQVNEFLKKKLGSFETYLYSSGLDRHFFLWNGVVDLVRNGNLQKSRLIVEQTLASFLVSALNMRGSISWNQANQQLNLQKTTPEVREFLGRHWNATRLRVAPLNKFCLERPDLFICRTDGFHLRTDQIVNPSSLLDEQSDQVSADTLTFNGKQSEETENKAVQFLKDIIVRQGVIGSKKKRLKSRFDLKDAPSDVRNLLGGQKDAVSFVRKHLQAFSLRHPAVFTTYKHSIDLNRTFCQPQPAAMIVEPLVVPNHNQQKISRMQNLAPEVGQLQLSLDSSVITCVQPEPSLSMPSNPLTQSDFPAATSCLPAADATVLASSLPLATSTLVTWPTFTASYTNVSCNELNKGSTISAAALLLPQMAYIPPSQVPLAQYQYLPSLGLPINLGQQSPSVQHPLKPPGFETLPQIALYSASTSSFIEDILPSDVQVGMTSCTPGVLTSQFTAPTVDSFDNMSASHILPVPRMSWRQLTPVEVEPVASFASTCVDPSISGPFVEELNPCHTQPLSFGMSLLLSSAHDWQIAQPLSSASTRSLENVSDATQPCYDGLESAMLDTSSVVPGVMDVMAAEGDKLEKTGESERVQDREVLGEPKKMNIPEDVEELNKSQDGFEESRMAQVQDSTVAHGTTETMASEGEILEKTGESEKTKALEVLVESKMMNIPVDVNELNKSQDGFEESRMAQVQDCTVAHGTTETMASEGEILEKTGESEKAKALEVLVESKMMNVPVDVNELNKMESQEGLEDLCIVANLAHFPDSENNEGKLLMEVPQVIRTSGKSKRFSETITNGILMEKYLETELVCDDSGKLKFHRTLNTDDAMVHASAAAVISSLNEAEVGISSPRIESSLKSVKGNSISPVTWKSMAQSVELPHFKEEFGQLNGISKYLTFLDEEARREDLSVQCFGDVSGKNNDLYETAESENDREEQDFEEVTGTVLSAVGNQVYVRREDDQVVQFMPEHCSRHFKHCCNLGRHFAFGESVSLQYKKFPRELVSARLVRACAADDKALGICCSDLHINLGHGRVTLTGKNYVVFMMSNQEMTGFITVNPHLFSSNDLIYCCSTKVSGFMTPWQSHTVVFTNQNDITFAMKSDLQSPVDRIPASSPCSLTSDVSCQTELTCSAMQTMANDNCTVVCHKMTQTLSTSRIISSSFYSGE